MMVEEMVDMKAEQWDKHLVPEMVAVRAASTVCGSAVDWVAQMVGQWAKYSEMMMAVRTEHPKAAWWASLLAACSVDELD